MSEYQLDGKILIQPYMAAVGIGPFTFDLSGQLPVGDNINTITVASYLGAVNTTANLISGVPTVALNIVTVFFQYPGVNLHGTHKLTFQYVLVSTRQDEADFWGVVVKDV